MTELFEDDDTYTGPPLDGSMVRQAEQSLGVRLPRSYVELLSRRNGGVPRNRCFRTEFPTSWAPGHFEIRALLGIGGEWGIEVPGQGSAYMIEEWGYPKIGVVVCDMPSGGHDAVMLDYSESGPDGEPAVAYVDEDRVPRRVAASFDDFLAGLVPCDQLA
jgi:hypothetical protein